MTVERKSFNDTSCIIEKTLAVQMTIDASAVDVGNIDQTHILRKNLILGKITASGKLVAYDETGTDDGRRTAYAILVNETDLKNGNPLATATDHEAQALIIGIADPSLCHGYDAAAKVDLEGANRIFFRS